jgi:hypothetical protein
MYFTARLLVTTTALITCLTAQAREPDLAPDAQTTRSAEAPERRTITPTELLLGESGRVPVSIVHTALDARFFASRLTREEQGRLSMLASRARLPTVATVEFAPYIEAVAGRMMGQKKTTQARLATQTMVCASLIAANDSPTFATELVSGWICEAGMRCNPAAVLGRSTLVREHLARSGADLQGWIQDSDFPLRDAYMVAWIAVAEARFLEGLGIALDTPLTPDEVADLIDAATAGGKVPDQMAGVSAQLRSNAMQHGPAGCSGDTMGLAAGPFGGCGMPDIGQPPSGDPSPIDAAARGAGPGPGMNPSRGGWSIPGQCQGLDPSRIFNSGGGAMQTGAATTYDKVIEAIFEMGLKAMVGARLGAAMDLVVHTANALHTPAFFPDPVPPESTPEPDTSTSNEQGEQPDTGPEDCEGEECAEGSGEGGGGGFANPMDDLNAGGLAGACGVGVGQQLIGCMFPSQPEAVSGGQTALLCNQAAPMDCGFEPCNFACACQNTQTGAVCSPSPDDSGPAACAGESTAEEAPCPEECQVMVVASMINPGLMPPEQLPDECTGCGVISNDGEEHPCLNNTPMPPAAIVPLCGAIDPMLVDTQATPWATIPHQSPDVMPPMDL